jgi:hypothetical protein
LPPERHKQRLPRRISTLALLGLAPGLASGPAFATTGTVFSPEVDDGERGLEYRISLQPDHDDQPERFSHRLHYQHALDDSLRWRLIALQREVDNDGLEFRYARLELQWQFLEDQEAGWDSALRYELQIAEGDDLPHRVRLAWTGKGDVTDRWQLRANFLTGREFGSGSNSGLLLETRAQATYRLNNGTRIGLEMFNDLNYTTDMGSFDDQAHQLGPIVKTGIGGWGVELSYLIGLSDGAADQDFRLIVGRGL